MRANDDGDVTPQTPEGGNQEDNITAEHIKSSQNITGSDIPSDPKTEDDSDDVVSRTLGSFLSGGTQIWYADQFAKKAHNKWKYCVKSNQWYSWNGRNWDVDDVLRIQAQTREFMIDELKKIDSDDDDSTIRDEIKEFKKMCNARNIKDIIEIVKAFPHIATNESMMDTNAYTLNVLNGELDLKDGMLHPHDPEHLNSKCCNVAYVPDAKCPEWEKHIFDAFDGDPDLIENVQQILGYTLFDGNPDSVFMVFNGSGRNGKSVTLDVIQHVLGSYSVSINPNTLMESGDGPGFDRIKIKGARLIIASEPGDTGKGRCALDTSFIKAATGGDLVSARHMRAESINFRIGGLFVIVTNTLPLIRDQSVAMRERVWSVPFNHYFTEEERKHNIKDILISEGSGILNWMIAGYRKYTVAGRLKKCKAIVAQTEEYLDDEDPYTGFFNDSGIVRNPTLSMPAARFYDAYVNWCRGHEGHSIRTYQAFGRHMSQRFQRKRTNFGMVYTGVGFSGQGKVTTDMSD